MDKARAKILHMIHYTDIETRNMQEIQKKIGPTQYHKASDIRQINDLHSNFMPNHPMIKAVRKYLTDKTCLRPRASNINIINWI